jgi:hypothetical protein
MLSVLVGVVRADELLYGFDDAALDGWYTRTSAGAVPPEEAPILGTNAPAQGAGYVSLGIQSNKHYTLVRTPDGFQNRVRWEDYDRVAVDVRLDNPLGWNAFNLLCRSSSNHSYTIASGQIRERQSNTWVTLRGPITPALTNYLYSEDWPSTSKNVRIVKFGMDHRRIMDGNAQGISLYNRFKISRNSTTELWEVRTAPQDIQQFNDYDVDGDGQTEDDRVSCHAFSLDEDNPITPVAPWYDTSVGCQKMYGGGVIFHANAKNEYSVFTEDGINEEEEGPPFQPRSNWTFFHASYEIFAPFRMYFLGLWQKKDFENNGDRFRVSFDKDSELRHLVMRYYMGIEGFRWVVRNGDQFYISEEVYKYAGEGPGDPGGKIHTVKPAAIRWATYNPRAPYHIAFDAAHAVFKKRTFDNVTAVGHLMFKDNLISGYIGYKWYAFEAEAVVHSPKVPSQHIAMNRDSAGGATGVLHEHMRGAVRAVAQSAPARSRQYICWAARVQF